MSVYIDREAFVERQQYIYCKNCKRRKNSKGEYVYAIGDGPCRACGIMDVIEDLEDFPAADVVGGVRCKDCVYWKYAEGKAFCESWDRFVENPDYYCASGRRRDG